MLEGKEIEESALWDAANQLRPYMDAAEYKEIVLDLLCLKSISVKPWMPKQAKWEFIIENINSGHDDIATIINYAFLLVQKSNQDYSGLFAVDYKDVGIPNDILSQILILFDQSLDVNKNDSFGAFFEYFLRNFALSEGKRAGQYYTPRSVVNLLVRILNPKGGKIYDPCCGTGGMFIHTINYLKEQNNNFPDVKFFGQESNPKTWRFAKKNLLQEELPHDLGESECDTLLKPVHDDESFDYCLANPPFNISRWNPESLALADVMVMGLPPDGCANYAWLQHIISRLNSNGKAAVILANGSLDAVDGGQKEIREKMINSGVVEAIISLPGELFYSTTIPVSIWVLNKAKMGKKGDVLFIDASSCEGNMIKRGLRELTIENVSDIVDVYRGSISNQASLNISNIRSAFVNFNEIVKDPVDLNPGRYTIESVDEILSNSAWSFEQQQDDIGKIIRDLSTSISKINKGLCGKGLNSVEKTNLTPLSSVSSAYRDSLDPSKFPKEEFDLYSIPSFDDSGLPEITRGEQIGSNKLIIRKPSILISRLNPRTPRIWMARPKNRRAICSTEFTVLEVDDEKLLSSIFTALHSKVAVNYLKSVARGTTGSRKRARESDLMNMQLPLTASLESPISDTAEELVNFKQHLLDGLHIIQQIIPEVADETYRKSAN